jgi:V/A-type H+-transporting ATPase subunit A
VKILSQGKIVKVAGPLIVAENMRDANMGDVVRVGKQKLIGEIIEMRDDKASIQVYEETAGIGPGDLVETTGFPMSVELAPGVLTSIFDGIQRPLTKIREMTGSNITRGIDVTSLDHEKKWDFVATAKVGDHVVMGDVLGTVQETSIVTHKIMVPKDVEGEIVEITSGSYNITETIAKVKDKDGNIHDVCMLQRWPVRVQRPYAEKLSPDIPMITGQRVIDTLFPITKGGTAAVPGPFGSGKTVVQHQLAKWSDVDIVVYIGCGERGNEMTDVLNEFPELKDPKSGESLMFRTVLIANTSDMPVAAREASIYTGITLAEYYRDMGYHTAMMADSTSRWAEALREISGRLEEMPADEGYPAYLPSRLAEFYERAGYVKTLNGAEGSVSVIGAVSPQGNDFSEPVTQNTKRFTRCFWALDKSLAYARHYPAINWNDSYSEYLGDLGSWYYDNVGHDFMSCRERVANLLLQENNLMQIVKLIGSDVLPDDQKLTIEIARVIRVGFLQQNAFHAVDTYVPLEKQLKMMETILYLYDKCAALVAKQVPVSRLLATGLFDELVKMKYEVPNDDFSKLDAMQKDIDAKLAAVAQG